MVEPVRSFVWFALAACVTPTTSWRPVSGVCRLDVERAAHRVDSRLEGLCLQLESRSSETFVEFMLSSEGPCGLESAHVTVDDRRYVFPRPPALIRLPMVDQPRRVVLEATDCGGTHLQIFSSY